MTSADNTLFLRLAGPMQSWGTSSRFQLRRTDAYPSKSGVLGMLLCSKGVGREDSELELEPLNRLLMGVRVDRGGIPDWDYHTVGAGIGIRKAEGGIKRTGNTKKGPKETLLSRRQYLYDASFLVALQGPAATVAAFAGWLNDPIWPVFLGRKCCIPGEPAFAGTGTFGSLAEALASVDWRARINAIDRDGWKATRTLDTLIEHPQGSPPPPNARLVHDVPQRYGFYSHEARWVIPGQTTVAIGQATQMPAYPAATYQDPYGPQYEAARLVRLAMDNRLCVFCKSPAVQTHHLDYSDVRPETLRSLCETCHDACTMLEYGGDRRKRIDPSDPEQRPEILRQIERMFSGRRLARRRELLEASRIIDASFFEDVPESGAKEGR